MRARPRRRRRELRRRAPSGPRGRHAQHPDLRLGSSVRGALDLVAVARLARRAADVELAGRLAPTPRPPAPTPRSPPCPGASSCSRARRAPSRRSSPSCGRRAHPSTSARRRRGRWRGKSLSPGAAAPEPGRSPGAPPKVVSDPAEVADLLRDQARRTETRADLQRRHDDLEQASPTVGVLDEAAMAGAYADDPDAAVDLLADLARATDPALRAKARRLAVRLLVPPARAGETERRGLDPARDRDRRGPRPGPRRHPRAAPWSTGPIRAEDLRWRGWRSPAPRGRAAGRRVRVGGRAAPDHRRDDGRRAGRRACAPTTSSPSSRSGRARWCCATCTPPPRPSAVLDALLDLRGGSTTDLALGLRTALAQATAARRAARRRPRAHRRRLERGRGPGPDRRRPPGAARVHTLVTVDDEDARTSCARLARAGGGRSVPLLRPSDAPAAVRALLR